MTKALPSGTLQSITDGWAVWQGDPAFKSALWQAERWLGRQNQGSPSTGQSPMNTQGLPQGLASWVSITVTESGWRVGCGHPHLDSDGLARLEVCPAPFLIHHHELSSISLKQGFSSAVVLGSPSVPLGIFLAVLSFFAVLWVCFGDRAGATLTVMQTPLDAHSNGKEP